MYRGLHIFVFAVLFVLIGDSLAHVDESEDTHLLTRDTIPSNSDITAAVGSVPNTSWFWTGRRGACASEADGVISLSKSLASSHGGSTLEQRLANKKVAMPQFGSSPAAKAAWRFASGTYATQASGTAFVVLGKCVRPGNTWETTELPTLQKGGKVTCVFQFTSADNWTKPQFLWAASGQDAACKAKLSSQSGLYPREFSA